MIGNPLEKLKFQCVTEVNLGLKKILKFMHSTDVAHLVLEMEGRG